MKNNPLGRGLAALIAGNKEYYSLDSGAQVVNMIQIDQIIPNPKQPRQYISEIELLELAESIQKFGILQPLLVYKIESNQYQIIAGERRWQAAKKAGLEEVPVIIKEISNTSEILEIALIENIQRQDLNILEEAESYDKLIFECNYTQEALAAKLGKSRSHIANALRLLKLPLAIQECIKKNQISYGHAKALVSAASPMELVSKILADNLSVRQVEDLIKNERNITRNHNKNQDIVDLERRIFKVLEMNTKIYLNDNGSGKIYINFDTLMHLDRFFSIISSVDINNVTI